MALCLRLIRKEQTGILWLQPSLTVAGTTALKYLFTLTLSLFTIYLTPLKLFILTDKGTF